MKEKSDWIQEVKIMEDIFIMEERKIRLSVRSRCLYLHPAHGVPANVAYAHHDNNRNVFDEWV